MTTRIEWTDETWNPVRGCRIVSEGCRNCYAMKFAHRYSGPGMPYEGLTKKTANGPVWTGEVRLVPDAMDKPLHWKKPRRIFVNSMSDLFHEDVPFEFIDLVFEVIEKCPQHTFQILTKRAERMAEWAGRKTLPRNAWMGVSVENQAAADWRIPNLLSVNAKVHFLSCEPLLGPVNLNSNLGGTLWIGGQRGCDGKHVGDGSPGCPRHLHHHHDDRCRRGLAWVIVGGESGPGARPMHPDWVRQIRDDCAVAEVPFFFKQWGAWVPKPRLAAPIAKTAEIRSTHDVRETMVTMQRVGKKAAGRELDRRTHDEYPGEFSATAEG